MVFEPIPSKYVSIGAILEPPRPETHRRFYHFVTYRKQNISSRHATKFSPRLPERSFSGFCPFTELRIGSIDTDAMRFKQILEIVHLLHGCFHGMIRPRA